MHMDLTQRIQNVNVNVNSASLTPSQPITISGLNNTASIMNICSLYVVSNKMLRERFSSVGSAISMNKQM